MTSGEMMVYTGLVIIVLGALMLGIFVPLFAHQRKRMERKIQEEYN